MRQLTGDRIGLGWRAALAAQTFAHLDDVDVIEILAEDFWRGGARTLRSLRSLAAHRPLLIHGVTLGLAGIGEPDAKRLDKMARLVNTLEPVCWSEHLAFVRGGGVEIGHLAAPPRNVHTLETAVLNTRRAHAVIGSAPLLENVATVIRPPDSTLDEATWVGRVLEGAGADGLLDLHNVFANAVNAGVDPMEYLRGFPVTRTRVVHLSGGRMIEIEDPRTGRRLRRVLDDHLHDVPPIVLDMLAYVGSICARPLDVIIERDGRFPEFGTLRGQLDAARAALAAGRAMNRAA